MRIFSEAPHDYGPRLDTVISASHTWKDEKEVANTYIRHMSYPYGTNLWGENIKNLKGQSLREDLFKEILSGTEIALHSRTTDVFGTLDNDDYFQYLGGLTLSIRSISGFEPQIYITNLSNPRALKQESLARFIGREIKSRYLNPEWIKAMLQEGYAGVRFIDKVVEHLFGFQVTNPELIGSIIWQAFYEVYVADKYRLGID